MKRKLTDLVVRFAWWLMYTVDYDADMGMYWDEFEELVRKSREKRKDQRPLTLQERAATSLTEGVVPAALTVEEMRQLARWEKGGGDTAT